MSQAKMQAYMERHKLGPLFEDMMNRVIRDMPEEPLVYLLRTIYKKAGMEIPQEIRYGGLRKSVDVVRSRSPERPPKTSLSMTDPTGLSASREYDRPWVTQKSRMKLRRSTEGIDKAGKKRPDWQGDTKIVATSFDELWENQGEGHKTEAASPGKKSRGQSPKRSAWATLGLDSGDTYMSGEYRGPSHQAAQSEEDLLAAEMVPASERGADEPEDSEPQAPVVSGARDVRVHCRRHRQELEGMLQGEGGGIAAHEPVPQPDDDVQDEAIELLESADDLKREGVENIPASGYKLSKIMRERSNEPCVKLNINLSPRGVDPIRHVDSMQSFEGYETDLENASPVAGRRWESDEDFESVSQVSGPRAPVWKAAGSDVDITQPHHSRSSRRNNRNALTTSAPEPFQQVTFGERDLEDFAVNKTWSPDFNVQTLQESSRDLEGRTEVTTARSGGWVMPDDSDAASVQDWNQRVKGRKRDPRSY